MLKILEVPDKKINKDILYESWLKESYNIFSKFKNKSLYKNFLPSSVFEVVLKNAYIIYFDENNKILDIDNILQKYIK